MVVRDVPGDSSHPTMPGTGGQTGRSTRHDKKWQYVQLSTYGKTIITHKKKKKKKKIGKEYVTIKGMLNVVRCVSNVLEYARIFSYCRQRQRTVN